MLGHANDQDLEEFVAGKLLGESSAVVHSHLEGCEECQHKLSSIALKMQWRGEERRTEPRVAANFKGRLKMLDPVTSVGPPHAIYVINISRNGMRIRSPRCLIPNTLVQVHFNGQAILGKVKYCVRTESGYYSGIKKVEDFN